MTKNNHKLNENCRSVIRACLNIVEENGDTYVAIHKDDDIECVVLVSIIRTYPILSEAGAHRRSDVVRHVEKERRFCLVCALGHLIGDVQTLLLHLLPLLLADVARHIENVRHPAAPVAFFLDKARLMPACIVCLILNLDRVRLAHAARHRGQVEKVRHRVFVVRRDQRIAELIQLFLRVTAVARGAVDGMLAVGDLLIEIFDQINAANGKVAAADRGDDLVLQQEFISGVFRLLQGTMEALVRLMLFIRVDENAVEGDRRTVRAAREASRRAEPVVGIILGTHAVLHIVGFPARVVVHRVAVLAQRLIPVRRVQPVRPA